MSTCISREGEYSDHRFDSEAPEFTCSRCWVFDEDAALVEIARLRTLTDPGAREGLAVAALADDIERALDGDDPRDDDQERKAIRYLLGQLRAALAQDAARTPRGGVLAEELAALADRWERENRRPTGAHDQVQAGVWSATRSDVADVRRLLAARTTRPAPDEQREGAS